jgi:hypothetical protein
LCLSGISILKIPLAVNRATEYLYEVPSEGLRPLHLSDFVIVVLFFETGSKYITQAGLRLMILLPLPPKC